MLSPHEGGESLEAVAQASSSDGGDPTTVDLPCFEAAPGGDAPLSAEGDVVLPESTEEYFVRPLSDALSDDESELVVGPDDEAVETPAVELPGLAAVLHRDEPLTWVFAGARPAGDAAFGDGRLAGEWFAEEWRAESGRQTDLVLDATWPGCELATLKAHLRSRVVRHRPDVTVLFFDHSDAKGGIEELSHFERRLAAILSVLSEIGTLTILVKPPVDALANDIDREVYSEALSGIAKERGVACLTLPAIAPPVTRTKTPNSAARNAALFLCREVIRAK